MKKILTAILAICLLLSLCACGGNTNTPSSTNSPQGTDPSVTEQSANTPNAVTNNPSENTQVDNYVHFISVSAGTSHALAIDSNGSLWAWGYSNGYNQFGQIGNGEFTTDDKQITPVKIMDNVIAASAGAYHSMALKADGTLWGWGANCEGRGGLGDGTNENKSTPVQIMEDVIFVSAGYDHTMAIKKDGSLWAWGFNYKGQIGDGTKDIKLVPVKVMDDVIAVSAGNRYTLAVKKDSSLWGWGNNYDGQLGTDEFQDEKVSPERITDGVESVFAGYYHSMAVMKNGSLIAWGKYDYGELGYSTDEVMNEAKNNLIPEKVMDGVVYAAFGEFHSVLLKTDGSLVECGDNRFGQMGNGKSGEDEDMNLPLQIMDDVVSVSANLKYTLAVKKDGTLWYWGEYFGKSTSLPTELTIN